LLARGFGLPVRPIAWFGFLAQEMQGKFCKSLVTTLLQKQGTGLKWRRA